MGKVRVDLGFRSYDILIGSGLVSRTGPLLREYKPHGGVFLVSNPTVFALWGRVVEDSLRGAGFRVIYGEIPDGEAFKTMDHVMRLIGLAVDNHLDRTDTLVALGGGVVGDLAGLAAALYQRGIDFVQVPTTLLAQVDSSVGGKTAVNHPRAKNMIGAFHQPRLVLADISTLATLAPREYRSGLAEVVKYGIIGDPELFVRLESGAGALLNRDRVLLEEVIEKCCSVKAGIVAEDEREGGRRAVLNLGHTFGHAIESATGYTRYSHGEAVALGISLAAGLACRLGLLPEADRKRIDLLLAGLGFDLSLPPLDFTEIQAGMMRDKKVAGGTLRLILPTAIGQVKIMDAPPMEQIKHAYAAQRRDRGTS